MDWWECSTLNLGEGGRLSRFWGCDQNLWGSILSAFTPKRWKWGGTKTGKERITKQSH